MGMGARLPVPESSSAATPGAQAHRRLHIDRLVKRNWSTGRGHEPPAFLPRCQI